MSVTYKCEECQEKIRSRTDHRSLHKAPCPSCDTCALTKISKDETIKSDKKAADLYWRVRRHNGR